MNYQRIYNEIINRAKNEEELGVRKRKNNVYYERHHIIPRCLKGNNDEINLVLLTLREHFLCHMLLCEIYPNNPEHAKLAYALWRMANGNVNNEYSGYTISARVYERLKGNAGKNISAAKIGIPRSEECKKKISDTKKKKKQIPWIAGKHHSDETKEKLRIISTGRKQSAESIQKGLDTRRTNGNDKHSEKTKQKISATKQASPYKYTDETKQKMRKPHNKIDVEYWSNIPERSEKTKQKMSESHKGQIAWNKGLKMSDEIKMKQSISAKKRCARTKAMKENNINLCDTFFDFS
jgi:hypothetical protein